MMKMNKKDAFTLLEILITLIILTLGVAVTVRLLSTGLVSSTDAENVTIAMNLTQSRMEEMNNLDFDTGVVNEPRAEVSGFPEFEREVMVSEPETDLKQVRITTYWSYKSDELSTTLLSYISRN